MSKILHVFLIFFMLAGKTTASSYCYSTTLYATTSKSTKSLSYYTNYDDCTITIRPSSYYSGGSYYLEIKWLSFDVKGNMPNCYNDYVEVFLTSIKAYTVKYYNYFYIKFNRQRGGSSDRGFVSGYITYNPNKVTVGPNTAAVVAGSIVGAVIFLIVLVLVIVYMCKRNRTHGAIVRQNPANTAILATTNTVSSGTTVMSQTVNAYPGTGAQMQYTSAYPTSYQKPAGYPQDPVYTGNPMTATYPTATTYQTAPGAGQPAFYPPASQGYGQAPMAPPAGIPTEPPPAYVQVNPSAP
eukprot:gene17997-19794_t